MTSCSSQNAAEPHSLSPHARCLQAAFAGKVTADQLLLYFGPNERKMGKQFTADPSMDDRKLTLKDFSCLPWLERFPHWHLGVKLLPATPPPPGVAATAAAAMSEGKDVDKAIAEARQKVSHLVTCVHATARLLKELECGACRARFPLSQSCLCHGARSRTLRQQQRQTWQ